VVKKKDSPYDILSFLKYLIWKELLFLLGVTVDLSWRLFFTNFRMKKEADVRILTGFET
jgi:hypothetical protein